MHAAVDILSDFISKDVSQRPLKSLSKVLKTINRFFLYGGFLSFFLISNLINKITN